MEIKGRNIPYVNEWINATSIALWQNGIEKK
jgi:hypothetical protein